MTVDKNATKSEVCLDAGSDYSNEWHISVWTVLAAVKMKTKHPLTRPDDGVIFMMPSQETMF